MKKWDLDVVWDLVMVSVRFRLMTIRVTGKVRARVKMVTRSFKC